MHRHENNSCSHDQPGAAGAVHPHHGPDPLRRRLWWALGLNAVFLVVEVIGGLVSGSLALLADAGHMVTDVAALALAIVVARLMTSAPTPRRTFGLMRAEVLGAFINGGTLVLIVAWIFWEAFQRLNQPVAVRGPLILAVATAGLGANLASAWILSRGGEANLNVRAAFLHMVGDALGSLGAIVAGAVVALTGWTPIDPLASVVIGGIILWSSVRLVRQTLHVLLNATPENIDYHDVIEALRTNPHVQEVFDLHIWTIATGMPALTAHIRLRPECCDTLHWQQCLGETQKMLRERFGITHTTLQMEPPGHHKDDRPI